MSFLPEERVVIAGTREFVNKIAGRLTSIVDVKYPLDFVPLPAQNDGELGQIVGYLVKNKHRVRITIIEEYAYHKYLKKVIDELSKPPPGPDQMVIVIAAPLQGKEALIKDHDKRISEWGAKVVVRQEPHRLPGAILEAIMGLTHTFMTDRLMPSGQTTFVSGEDGACTQPPVPVPQSVAASNPPNHHGGKQMVYVKPEMPAPDSNSPTTLAGIHSRIKEHQKAIAEHIAALRKLEQELIELIEGGKAAFAGVNDYLRSIRAHTASNGESKSHRLPRSDMPIPKTNGQDRTSLSMSFMLKDGTEVTVTGMREVLIFRELIAHRGTFITKEELKRCLGTSEDWTVHQPMNSIRKQLNEQTDGRAGAFLVGRRGEGYCWDESGLPT